MNTLRRNPFRSAAVRPGAIAYIFPPHADSAGLVQRLRANGWWGQIVGPHGSGKSTLIAALVPVLDAAGRAVVQVALHDGQSRLSVPMAELSKSGRATQLIVDGYEQLSRWSRFRLKHHCRRHGWGLLITTHASMGLPDLARTTTSAELAEHIAGKLLDPGDETISAADVRAAFEKHRGDLRETLFALYDLYERRHRT